MSRRLSICLVGLFTVVLGGAVTGCEDDLEPAGSSDAASTDADMAPAADASVPVLDLEQCDVVVDRTDGVIADGIDHATVTATVRDTQGAPLRGYRVTLLVSGSKNLVGFGGDSDSNGEVRIAVASTLAEAKLISAVVDDNLPLHTRPSVRFIAGPPAAARSSLTANPAVMPADGASKISLTATLADAYGNPVAGGAISLSANGTGNAFAPNPPQGVTDANGLFRAQMSSTDEGAKLVTATSADMTFGTTVLFESALPSIVTVSSGGGAGCIPITYSVRQAGAKRVSVLVEVDVDHSGRYVRAMQAGSTSYDGVDGITTSSGAAGQTHTFLWNSSLAIPHGTTSTARVRITPYLGQRAGLMAEATVAATNGLSTSLATTTAIPFAAQSSAVGDFDRDGNLDLVAVGGIDVIAVLRGRADGTLMPATLFPVSGPATRIDVADFNRDGKLDVVIAYFNQSIVTVLPGDGDGSFGAGSDYAVQAPPRRLAIEDFNHDGRPDIFTTSYSTSATTLLGVGDGTFLPGVDYSLALSASMIAAADFDRDGTLDLALAASGGSSVQILRGTGSGGFAIQPPVDLVFAVAGLATGDVDGNGTADLVATASRTLTVFLGAGNGTFTKTGSYQTAGAVNDVRLADLDGDGRLDATGWDWEQSGFAVWSGEGNGTFRSATTYPAVMPRPFPGGPILSLADMNHDTTPDFVTADDSLGIRIFKTVVPVRCDAGLRAPEVLKVFTQKLAAVDFDGDGKLDVLTGSPLRLEFGTGNGGFARGTELSLPFSAGVPVPADFNLDGNGDLLIPGSYGSSCVGRMMLGAGNGTFVSSDVAFCEAHLAELNGDGIPDVIAVSGAGPFVALGNGDGTFQPGIAFTLPNSATLGPVGDFTGDGVPDLLYGASIAGELVVLVGAGDGRFIDTVRSRANTFPNPAITAGDFNGDGKLDVALLNNGPLQLLLNVGGGVLQPSYSMGCADATGTSMVAADFNRDGVIDLVTDQSLCLSTGNGTFVGSSIVSPGAVQLAGDFDGDGRLDVGALGNGGVSVMLAGATGGFQQFDRYVPGSYLTNGALADFNRDGRPDVAMMAGFQGDVRVFLGDANGKLAAPSNFVAGLQPSTIATADFDHDGAPDLVIGEYDDIAFLHGDGNGGFAAPTRSALPATAGYLAVGDLDLDGSLDLVTASVVMLGRGDGTFAQAGSYGSGGSVAVADVNRDGRPDVLVIDQYANLALRVLLGNGDGTLTSAGSFYANAAAFTVTVADVNRDGKPDAVILGYDRAVVIMLGNGDGTFAAGTKTTIPYSAPSVAVVDFDRDGHLDLITNSQYSDGGGVSLLLGRGDGSFGEPHNYALGVSNGDVITGDLNRDGMTDVVVISNTTSFAVGFGK